MIYRIDENTVDMTYGKEENPASMIYRIEENAVNMTYGIKENPEGMKVL